jgi:predicted nucleic acid-binding protein
MTVVVADTSPLNYLILIGEIDVLPQLYGGVVAPRQVIVELTAAEAPDSVKAWAGRLPSWIEARDAAVGDEEMRRLDLGERAAILLAESEPGALLLIDETAGRIEASRRGIRNTGTLGVLRAAASRDFVDLATALARLLETNFRVSTDLVSDILAEDAERRRRPE